MGRSRIIFTDTAEETIARGREVGQSVSPGNVLCFFGELGAGKTTFIKGIVNALHNVQSIDVCSPTFTYLQIYEGKCPVYHFDLYRLKSVDDFLSLGFEEYLFSDGICCIEWSERISPLLPSRVLKITLEHAGNDKRKIILAS